MKHKFIPLIVASLFAMVQTQAQQYDTLMYNVGMPQYYVPNPLDSMHFVVENNIPYKVLEIQRISVTEEQFNNSNHLRWPSQIVSFDSVDYALGFFPDSTITLIGIAWADQTSFITYLTIDSAEIRLYAPEGHDMFQLASKRIRNDTVFYNRVYAPWRGWGQPDYDYILATHLHIYEHVYPLAETFFDREYNVTDSFYVSIKYWGTDPGSGRVYKYDYSLGWVEWFMNVENGQGHDGDTIRHFPVQKYITKHDTASVWQYGELHHYPLVFPIIRRACDTCPEVQGLRWSRLGSGTTAFVQWDAGVNHRDWQLSYGPTGTPAGEGTVVDCPIAQSVLSGMAAGHPYDIYVRARCRFARDEWTGWSGPLEVGFGNPGEGIEGAATDIAAELTPNPATGRVRVSCGEALRRVEVYDMQGRRCLAQEAQGSETVLDISALAAGRYTVLLHTATTTAAKALVVQ